MPIFSPVLDEEVLVVDVAELLDFMFELLMELLLFVVSDLLHPSKRAAHATQRTNKVFLSIGCSFRVQKERGLN